MKRYGKNQIFFTNFCRKSVKYVININSVWWKPGKFIRKQKTYSCLQVKYIILVNIRSLEKNPVNVMSTEHFDMDADKEIQISSLEYSLVCHISEVSAIDYVSKLFGVSKVDINLMWKI